VSRELLEQRWQEHLDRRFPDVTADAIIDLADYDGAIAGLVECVVSRSGRNLPAPLEVDDVLTRRVHATGNEDAARYVDQLNELVELASNVWKAER